MCAQELGALASKGPLGPGPSHKQHWHDLATKELQKLTSDGKFSGFCRNTKSIASKNVAYRIIIPSIFLHKVLQHKRIIGDIATSA